MAKRKTRDSQAATAEAPAPVENAAPPAGPAEPIPAATGEPRSNVLPPKEIASSSVFAATRRTPVAGTPFNEDARYVWRVDLRFDDTTVVKAGDPVTDDQVAVLGPVKMRRMWYFGQIQLADAKVEDY